MLAVRACHIQTHHISEFYPQKLFIIDDWRDPLSWHSIKKNVELGVGALYTGNDVDFLNVRLYNETDNSLMI